MPGSTCNKHVSMPGVSIYTENRTTIVLLQAYINLLPWYITGYCCLYMQLWKINIEFKIK